tara:strand:+ start:396 stop:638 length:243 start_codon:yes stop_codon:yes gene_type:complete
MSTRGSLLSDSCAPILFSRCAEIIHQLEHIMVSSDVLVVDSTGEKVPGQSAPTRVHVLAVAVASVPPPVCAGPERYKCFD